MRHGISFVLGLVLGGAVSAAVAQEVSGTVVARRVHLVDAEGNVRARLYVGDDGVARTEGLDGKPLPRADAPRAAPESATHGPPTPAMLRAAELLADGEKLSALGERDLVTFARDAGWTTSDLFRAGMLTDLVPATRRLAAAKMGKAAESLAKLERGLAEGARLLREGDGKGAAKAVADALVETK